jgi:hypothetical protein
MTTCSITCRKSRGNLLSELSIMTKNRLHHKLNFLHVVNYAKSKKQKVFIFIALHKPIAFEAVSQKMRPKPFYVSFNTMLEMQDSNDLKDSGLLQYTKGMPVMYLSNVSTSSGVVNGMCGTATHIVPYPSGTRSLIRYYIFPLTFLSMILSHRRPICPLQSISHIHSSQS